MISVYLKLYWSAFFNVRLQVKCLFFTRISNDHPLILTTFNAKEILFYLLVIEDKRYDRLFKTILSHPFTAKRSK